MKEKIRILCLYLLPIVFIVIFSSLLGQLYINLLGDNGGLWIGSKESITILNGLFLGYAFFIPLIGTILGGGKGKHKVIGILVGIELILFLLSFRILLTFLIAALVGWLLGELILLIYKKLSSQKKVSKFKK